MKTNQVCGVIPAFMLGLVYFVFSDGKKYCVPGAGSLAS